MIFLALLLWVCCWLMLQVPAKVLHMHQNVRTPKACTCGVKHSMPYVCSFMLLGCCNAAACSKPLTDA